jgi:hypothetical protein
MDNVQNFNSYTNIKLSETNGANISFVQRYALWKDCGSAYKSLNM